ncbi:MarC family protein [Methylocystis sp. SC2]|uniref:MarC family protein n=1 Tax=Methylocystis sp. (strain SC2) TaxID=187303 RepID=UPI00027AED17|nr:MarC family protein [Methylocystis sp. SC2]CCJ05730.1 Putative multiple antibiotic resistance (MarC)-related protein [Methylocystis sp. SC2]
MNSSLVSDIGAGVFRIELTLFFSTFTTLLAVINPFEVLPVFLLLLRDKSNQERGRVAFMACLYALLLILFFLFFGAVILKIFGVSLSMVRIAGGIVLMKIGFELFLPSSDGDGAPAFARSTGNIAFMPLAMPLMIGPGPIATVLGMMATVEHSSHEALAFGVILGAIFLAVAVTYACLAFATRLTTTLGPLGIDAATRIVGFFVSAMGVSLIFNGVMDALRSAGFGGLH